MFSTPLIDSSSGVATVSAMTFGFAPGYCARTTIEGGTTSGYSDTGSARSAIRPASSISGDSTPAKIGRSMKNFERFIAMLPSTARGAVVLRAQLGLRVHRHRLRRHHGARPHALHAVDDDAPAARQARHRHAQPRPR